MELKRKLIGLAAMILVFLLGIAGCSNDTVKIGFIGSLSSKNSQLSIDARNTIQLAIDLLNENGGINGHRVDLIVKDDEASPETALVKHKEFVNEDVQLVIGHMTSNMAESVLESQSEELLFISPSMGAASLTGLDDFFLRTSPLTDNQALTFFKLVELLAVENVVITYDLMNAEYSERLAKYAMELNEEKRDLDLTLIPFDSRVDDMATVADQIMEVQDVELVLMISQAIDTAYLAQKLKQSSPDLRLASVSWSMTEDLILNGGSHVDGMYFIGIFRSENPSSEKVAFEKAFYDKYQYAPSFICYMTFDAFEVLTEAMKSSGSFEPKAVKEEIVKMDNIHGLEEVFSMDEFGDNDRGYLLYQLTDNEFVPMFD